MSKMDKLMSKKDEPMEMDENYKSSKMHMLKELKNQMLGMMHGDAQDGIKKVEVMADDEDGLSDGLDKAKDLVDSKALPDMSDMGKPGMSEDEESEDSSEPSESLSDEELEQLQMLLDKMKRSR